jgi:hypothetical protein
MGAGRPKGSGGVNKSAVIREYITANPDSSTNEVVDALAKKGINVSQALVAGVRSRTNGGPGNKKRTKIAQGEVTTKELNSVHSVVENFEEVSDAKNMIKLISDLVEEIGSVERLNEVLEAYDDYQPSESGDIAVEDSSEEFESDDDDEDSDSDTDEDEDEDDE